MNNGKDDLFLPVGGRERMVHCYLALYKAAQVANRRRIFPPPLKFAPIMLNASNDAPGFHT